MPSESSEGLLSRDGLGGNSKPDLKNGGLISGIGMFDPAVSSATSVAAEEGACDEELTAIGWPPAPLVRTTSTSSAGSAEAEESEVGALFFEYLEPDCVPGECVIGYKKC